MRWESVASWRGWKGCWYVTFGEEGREGVREGEAGMNGAEPKHGVLTFPPFLPPSLPPSLPPQINARPHTTSVTTGLLLCLGLVMVSLGFPTTLLAVLGGYVYR